MASEGIGLAAHWEEGITRQIYGEGKWRMYHDESS